MKTIAAGLALILSMAFQISQAQAYWVVETNARQKNFTVVRFYNRDDQLIYEERHQGIFLNPSKRKHKRKLNSMLETYLKSDKFYSEHSISLKRREEETSTGPTFSDPH